MGLADGPSYHELQPWGMDILNVGNSLGAGAIALETSTGLYRIGPDGKGTYRLVAQGPLRSTFDLKFEDVPVECRFVNINQSISIIAGKPWYKSMVIFEGIGIGEQGLKFVTAIVNLRTNNVYSNIGSGYAYMFKHDNQAFNGEKLGMAIIVPNYPIEVLTAPEEGEGITQEFFTMQSITESKYLLFHGWLGKAKLTMGRQRSV